MPVPLESSQKDSTPNFPFSHILIISSVCMGVCVSHLHRFDLKCKRKIVCGLSPYFMRIGWHCDRIHSLQFIWRREFIQRCSRILTQYSVCDYMAFGWFGWCQSQQRYGHINWRNAANFDTSYRRKWRCDDKTKLLRKHATHCGTWSVDWLLTCDI